MKQKPYEHIKDAYFRAKLESGLIPYKPEDWVVLENVEDNAEHKRGRK